MSSTKLRLVDHGLSYLTPNSVGTALPACTFKPVTLPTCCACLDVFPLIIAIPPSIHSLAVAFDVMDISTVLVGSLTTTFTPPSECSTTLLSEFDLAGATGFVGHWGYQCQVGETSLVPKPTCFPEGHLSSWPSRHERSSGDILIYSPGYVCPAGWTSACSISRGQNEEPPTASGTRGIFSGTQIMWNAIQAGQVIIGCCPQ